MKNTAATVQWILRVGVFGEFVGHGAFALSGKEAWIGWITSLLSVTPEVAGGILTAIGIFDVCIGIIVLVAPIPAALLWAATWGFLTALVRPIVGDPIWDFVERWANWAAPLALLFLVGAPKNARGWFRTAR